MLASSNNNSLICVKKSQLLKLLDSNVFLKIKMSEDHGGSSVLLEGLTQKHMLTELYHL